MDEKEGITVPLHYSICQYVIGQYVISRYLIRPDAIEPVFRSPDRGQVTTGDRLDANQRQTGSAAATADE